MSPITTDSPFIATPRISRETFDRVLAGAGSPWAARAGEIYAAIVTAGHDPAVWLAICAEEHSFGTNRNSVLWRNDTRSWTNARTVRDPRISGWEIVHDPVRDSDYVRYADVLDSVRDGCYRISDPTYRYVREGRTTIAAVFAIWTEGNGTGYAAAVVERVTVGCVRRNLPRLRVSSAAWSIFGHNSPGATGAMASRPARTRRGRWRRNAVSSSTTPARRSSSAITHWPSSRPRRATTSTRIGPTLATRLSGATA
jgi:hypothetical protein